MSHPSTAGKRPFDLFTTPRASQLDKLTLSASNLAALSDSNLSLTEAQPGRPYNAPFTATYIAKYQFEKNVRQYYLQLTEGCHKETCSNRFCASSPDCVSTSQSLALVMSLVLASSQNQYYKCLSSSVDQPLKKSENDHKSFIETLLNTTPFRTMYTVPNLDNLFKVAHRAIHDHSHTLSISEHRGTTSLTSSLENLALQGRRTSASESEGSTFKKLSRQLSNSVGNLNQWSTEMNSIHGVDITLNNIPMSESCHSSLTSLSDVASICFDINDDLGSELHESGRSLTSECGSLDGVQQLSLTHLTVPMLKAALAKYDETLDPSFIQNTIRTVFTSSDSLNDSFRIDEHFSNSPNNLDIKAVKIAYDLLLNHFDRDIYKTILMNSIELHLSSLVPQNIEPEDIAQLIILMECPSFKRKLNHALRQKFCSIVSLLSAASREEFCKYLLNYDQDSFERRMGMFRDHFMLSLCQKQRTEPHLIELAEVLSVFFQANNMAVTSIRGAHIIPKRMFYVNDLGKKLDLNAEHAVWFERVENNTQSSNSERKTSLLDYPFLLDPASKVYLLHLGAVVKMRQCYQEALLHQARISQLQHIFLKESDKSLTLTNSMKSAMCPYLVLNVRRESLIPDTISQVKLKTTDLKKPLRVKYVGGGEQGVDYGGLQKEFFQLICLEIFDPDYGMFIEKDNGNVLWFNGNSYENEEEFELVGVILGLAIYNGVILDIRLPNVIYKMLQGRVVTIEDFEEIEPNFARGLKEMLKYPDDDVEDIFCQTFQITEEVVGEQKLRNIDLIPNGSQTNVTNENRFEFVEAVVNYKLNISIEKQFQAFSRGFHKVCGIF
ncbi:putative E3 ubiquitin-protein ligase HERC3 isoform X2 [Tubulanus polymorphus]|uniref:putative E3 ubiquitin-protein ligase HERC3 isoform X2 n=1 Tax=Tubulanus polymorphus TaxID=672921 RepID=UPI003DA257D1